MNTQLTDDRFLVLEVRGPELAPPAEQPAAQPTGSRITLSKRSSGGPEGDPQVLDAIDAEQQKAPVSMTERAAGASHRRAPVTSVVTEATSTAHVAAAPPPATQIR